MAQVFNKQEPGLGDLGNSQPIWIAKDAKIQKWPSKTDTEESPGMRFSDLLLKLQEAPEVSHKRFGCISSLGCCQEVPQSGWPEQQKCTISQFWR